MGPPVKRAKIESLNSDLNASTKQSDVSTFLPALLHEEELLVPIKLDVTFGGCRFQDSLCWKLYGSCIEPVDFAAQTCADLGLSPGMQQRIALQLSEQLQAYRELVVSLHALAASQKSERPPWHEKLHKLLALDICIRCNSLEYEESLYWDPMNADITPEVFARTTCADQGLPREMEPIIAYKIRDAIFREVVRWVDNARVVGTDPTSTSKATASSPSKSKSKSTASPANTGKRGKEAEMKYVSKIRIQLIPSSKVEGMAIDILTKERPLNSEVQSILPNSAYMPADRDSNASLFL